MTHSFVCKCRSCRLRAEFAGIKMQWAWALHWRLDWRSLAKEQYELVESIGPDAEGGRA